MLKLEQILSQLSTLLYFLNESRLKLFVSALLFDNFCIMNFLKRIFARLRKPINFSAANPENFEEVWSFNSSAIRVISLGLVILLLFSLGLLYLFGSSFSSITGQADTSIEREKLEKQRKSIEDLSRKLENQERYINSVKLILLGEVPFDTDLDSLNDVSTEKMDSILLKDTDSEKELAAKVKDDMRTSNDEQSNLNYFSSPVLGVISQKFDKKNHPGIDVVTEKDKAVKACLAGTVIYSGYSRKDGYILIIDHANGFISVYKHNKTVLKKLGDKVRMGDPVSIVGNTGSDTDGPHLHFELWHNSTPVNPSDYINFKK